MGTCGIGKRNRLRLSPLHRYRGSIPLAHDRLTEHVQAVGYVGLSMSIGDRKGGANLPLWT
jgi:hypothetical protein